MRDHISEIKFAVEAAIDCYKVNRSYRNSMIWSAKAAYGIGCLAYDDIREWNDGNFTNTPDYTDVPF